MIPGKLYRYKYNSATVIIMENREWLYELQDIRAGDVFLCIETQSINNDDLLNVIISYGESLIVRARLLDANGEIGWAICCEPHWDIIS